MTEATLLYRQIHPTFVQAGRVTRQAFNPTEKDAGKLSVYDGDQISPSDALEHYTKELLLKSCGVMAIEKSQCTSLHIDVVCDGDPIPAHAHLNFAPFSKSVRSVKAKQLASSAQKRGWLLNLDEPDKAS
jgi:hypothetical protein